MTEQQKSIIKTLREQNFSYSAIAKALGVTVATVIDPQTFDMVQAELARRSAGTNRHSGVHLLSGKIKCGDCGGWYGSKVWHSNDKFRRIIWQCNNKYKNKDKRCTTAVFDENQIKERFTIAVNKLLTGSSKAISTCEEALAATLDTSELEQKQQALLTEMQTLDSALRHLIQQNATTAQDQNEYRKSYTEITQKFSKAEEQKKHVDQKLSDLLERRGIIENFIKRLKEQNGQISEFSENLWCGLLDYVTAYADGRLVFRFKNGSEFEG